MADITLGKIKNVYRGEWSSSTAYEEGDIIGYDGAFYISVKAGTDKEPVLDYNDSGFPTATKKLPLRYGAYGALENFSLAGTNFAQRAGIKALNREFWKQISFDTLWFQNGGDWNEWDPDTYYEPGEIVTRTEDVNNQASHKHVFYAMKRNYAEDPLLNLTGGWEVLIHGGGKDFTHRITHLCNSQPIGWRGHPYLTMPNWGTGTTNPWKGNIPPRLIDFGTGPDGNLSPGARNEYNGHSGNGAIGALAGLNAIRWDGTPVMVSGAGAGAYNYTSTNHASTSPVAKEKPWHYSSSIRAQWKTWSYKTQGKLSSNLLGGTTMDNRNETTTFAGSAQEAMDYFQDDHREDNYLGTINFSTFLPRAISFIEYGGICVLFDDGTIEMKGENVSYQLTGDSATDSYDHGVHLGPSIFGGKRIVKLVADTGNSERTSNAFCALDEDGEIWTWGDNSDRQCGIGPEAGVSGRETLGMGYDDNTDVLQPINLVSDLCFEGNKIVDIFGGGGDHGMFAVIDTAGNLWTWGSGVDGQLGYATASGFTTAGYCAVPNKVDVDWSTYGGIQKVMISGDHDESSLWVLDGEGQIWNCGNNDDGFLGSGDTTNTGTSGTITRRTGWTGLSGSISNFWVTGSIAAQNAWFTKTDGTFWGIGDNSEYQLATGNATSQYAPVQIPDVSDIMDVQGRVDSSTVQPSMVALDKHGSLWNMGIYYYSGSLTGDAGNNYIRNQLSGSNRYGPKNMQFPLQCYRYGARQMRDEKAYYQAGTTNLSNRACYVLTWSGHLLRFAGENRYQHWQGGGSIQSTSGGCSTHHTYNT